MNDWKDFAVSNIKFIKINAAITNKVKAITNSFNQFHPNHLINPNWFYNCISTLLYREVS